MATQPDLLTRRFIRLIEHIRDQRGASYGWKAQTAALIDMDRSHFGKIMEGSRAVSWKAASRAADALGVAPAYFTASPDEDLDPAGYFLAASARPGGAPPPRYEGNAEGLREMVRGLHDGWTSKMTWVDKDGQERVKLHVSIDMEPDEVFALARTVLDLNVFQLAMTAKETLARRDGMALLGEVMDLLGMTRQWSPPTAEELAQFPLSDDELRVCRALRLPVADYFRAIHEK